MSYLVICTVALLASCLTFFSGFGLGTLLLPAFTLFFPVEKAVALTAVVHLLNSLFKLVMVGRYADLGVVVRFGLPATVAALLGAWILAWLAGTDPLISYTALHREVDIMPAKLVVGVLLLLFASMELLPTLRHISFPARYIAVGGAVSGFFGGLAGMQGALRSAFLIRAGLSKESFIATGVAVACLIDFSRLSMYLAALDDLRGGSDYALLVAAILSAFLGAVLGNRFLKKMTMPGIQRIVGIALLCVATGLISGLL
jgi:uncharacterized protein